MIKPYYNDEKNGIIIYHGDCLDILESLRGLNAIITDPPFAFTGGISNGRSSECSGQFFLHWWRDVCTGIQKAADPAGSGFIWCDWKTAHIIAEGFKPREQVYDFWRVPQMLFHYREMPGQGQPFRSSVDMIAYARGPKHKDPPIPNTTHNMISQYWYYGKHEYHPAEKSVDLCRTLLGFCSKEGDTILDPFAGSMTTAIACKQTGRKCIAIELEEHFCEIGASRIQQVLPL